MLKPMKLLCLAALLMALTTSTLRADLILVDSSDSRDSFSATFHWTPDEGSSQFRSPDGVFWAINIRDGNVGTYLLATVTHTFPSMLAPAGFYITPTVTTGILMLGHPDGPFTHTDVFTVNLIPLPLNPTTLVVTFEGHSESEAVPDAASSIMLLGLGLTALGTLCRSLRS
jgi:hypothetical protein